MLDERTLKRLDQVRQSLVPSPEEFVSDDQPESPGLKAMLLAFALAGLILAYHVDHALAQEIISGESHTSHISIHWEYDLLHSTGQLQIWNLPEGVELDDWGDHLYLGCLLPAGATNIVTALEAHVTLMQCQIPCNAVMLGQELFAAMPRGAHTVVTFDIPALDPVQVYEPVSNDVAYGRANYFSGLCDSKILRGTLSDFVTVRPVAIAGDCDEDGDIDMADFLKFQTCFTGSGGTLEPGCECADFDDDGDVDLSDFWNFQTSFTGPRE